MKKVAILLLGSAVLTGCGSDDSGDSRASSSYIGAIEAVDANADTMTINSMPLSLASTHIELNGHYVNSNELAAGMQVCRLMWNMIMVSLMKLILILKL